MSNVNFETVLRFHEALEVAEGGGAQVIRCVNCSHVFCGPDDNYKQFAIRHIQELEDLVGRRVPSGEPYNGVFQQYYCPGCAVLLQTDVYCAQATNDESPLQDFWLTPQRG